MGFGQVVYLIRQGVITMKLFGHNKSYFSKVLIYGAIAAVLFSVLGWLGIDIWLASTQWLLVAAVLILFGLYLK